MCWRTGCTSATSQSCQQRRAAQRTVTERGRSRAPAVGGAGWAAVGGEGWAAEAALGSGRLVRPKLVHRMQRRQEVRTAAAAAAATAAAATSIEHNGDDEDREDRVDTAASASTAAAATTAAAKQRNSPCQADEAERWDGWPRRADWPWREGGARGDGRPGLQSRRFRRPWRQRPR